MFGGTGIPIPPQDVAEVSKNWPAGNVNIRMANYLLQAQQKWTVAAVPNVGGYPGSPYFKITIAGTDRALAATADAEVVAVPAFTGAPEQLWRIDQLTGLSEEAKQARQETLDFLIGLDALATMYEEKRAARAGG